MLCPELELLARMRLHCERTVIASTDEYQARSTRAWQHPQMVSARHEQCCARRLVVSRGTPPCARHKGVILILKCQGVATAAEKSARRHRL